MKGARDRSIDELIDSVPWGRLTHAYDFALDAPAMLHAQVGATEFDNSFDDWLFCSVTHQGTPYSGTAPALWLLHRIVDAQPEHPALEQCLRAVAVCAKAISWAESRSADAGEPDDDAGSPRWYRSSDGEPVWASAMPPDYETPSKTDGKVHDDYFKAAIADIDTLKACVAVWHPTIIACLMDRTHLDDSVEAGAAVVQLWPDGPVADALTALVGDTTVAEHQRAGALYALFRAGLDVAHLAGGVDRALRFAFALGQPARAGSLAELVGGLRDLAWLTKALPQGLPGAEPWLIPAVVATILEHTPLHEASAEVVEALAGVARRPSGPFGATYEWGTDARLGLP
jgi:hypothetical protein